MQFPVEFKTVGMTFLAELAHGADYPGEFHRLAEIIEKRKEASLDWHAPGDATTISEHAPDCVPVLLYRNPENPYDANAIEVHVPMLGRRSMVGHVPRELAAEMAPVMDSGEQLDAEVVHVLVEPGHEDNPGILVQVNQTSKRIKR